MQTSAELKNLLQRIDHKGYPAYKDTRGSYEFPGYVLSIDHVQGDPFAAPSKVSIHVRGKQAGFPEHLYQKDDGMDVSRNSGKRRSIAENQDNGIFGSG